MKPAASRFEPSGRCKLCAGGWQCKPCQADNAERDRALGALFHSAAAGHRQNEIYRTCSALELESDEMASREDKAMALLGMEAEA